MRRIFLLVSTVLLLLATSIGALAQKPWDAALSTMGLRASSVGGIRCPNRDKQEGLVPIGETDYLAFGIWEGAKVEFNLKLFDAELPGYPEEVYKPVEQIPDAVNRNGYLARIAPDGQVKWSISTIDGEVVDIKAAAEGEKSYVVFTVRPTWRKQRETADHTLFILKSSQGGARAVTQDFDIAPSAVGFQRPLYVYAVEIGENGELGEPWELAKRKVVVGSSPRMWFSLGDMVVKNGEVTLAAYYTCSTIELGIAPKIFTHTVHTRNLLPELLVVRYKDARVQKTWVVESPNAQGEESVQRIIVAPDAVYVSVSLVGDGINTYRVKLFGQEIELAESYIVRLLLKLDYELTAPVWAARLPGDCEASGMVEVGSEVYVVGTYGTEISWGSSHWADPSEKDIEAAAYWGVLDAADGHLLRGTSMVAGYAQGQGLAVVDGKVYTMLVYAGQSFGSVPDPARSFINFEGTRVEVDLCDSEHDWAIGLACHSTAGEFIAFLPALFSKNYLQVPVAGPVPSRNGKLLGFATQTGGGGEHTEAVESMGKPFATPANQGYGGFDCVDQFLAFVRPQHRLTVTAVGKAPGAKITVLQNGKQIHSGSTALEVGDVITVQVKVLGFAYKVEVTGATPVQGKQDAYTVNGDVEVKVAYTREASLWAKIAYTYDLGDFQNLEIFSDYWDDYLRQKIAEIPQGDTLTIYRTGLPDGYKLSSLTVTGATEKRVVPVDTSHPQKKGWSEMHVYSVDAGAAEVKVESEIAKDESKWKSLKYPTTAHDADGNEYLLTVEVEGKTVNSGDKLLVGTQFTVVVKGKAGSYPSISCSGAVEVPEKYGTGKQVWPFTYKIQEDAEVTVNSFVAKRVPLTFKVHGRGKLLVYDKAVEDTAHILQGPKVEVDWNERVLVKALPDSGYAAYTAAQPILAQPGVGATGLVDEGQGVFRLRATQKAELAVWFKRQNYLLTVKETIGVSVLVRRGNDTIDNSTVLHFADTITILVDNSLPNEQLVTSIVVEGAKPTGKENEYRVMGNVIVSTPIVSVVPVLLKGTPVGSYTVGWVLAKESKQVRVDGADQTVLLPLGVEVTLSVAVPEGDYRLKSVEPSYALLQADNPNEYRFTLVASTTVQVNIALIPRNLLTIKSQGSGKLIVTYTEPGLPKASKELGESEDELRLLEGTLVSVLASPAPHFQVEQIRVGENLGFPNGGLFTLSQPVAVSVIFARITYRVQELATRGSGRIILTSRSRPQALQQSDTVCDGDTLTLKLQASEGFELVPSSLRVEGLKATETAGEYTVEGNVRVKADFRALGVVNPVAGVQTPNLLTNPVSEAAVITHAETLKAYSVVGIDGTVHLTGNAGGGSECRIPVYSLPSGIYLVRLQMGDGRSLLLRFTKE